MILIKYFGISDVFMPKMGGKELLSKLHKEKKTSFVPMIFLTATAEDGEFSKTSSLNYWGRLKILSVGLLDGRTDGAVDCISKPFHVRYDISCDESEHPPDTINTSQRPSCASASAATAWKTPNQSREKLCGKNP